MERTHALMRSELIQTLRAQKEILQRLNNTVNTEIEYLDSKIHSLQQEAREDK
jgi:prefoldin subunit 5